MSENEFIKYPSLTNHYRSKDIAWWLEKYPELNTETFQITEKIHGSNICLIFNGQDIQIASRNRILDEGENFFGILDVLKEEKHQVLIDKMQIFSRAQRAVVRIYGEIFGNGVQKGVVYQEEKRILFFDMMISNQKIWPDGMNTIFREHTIEDLLVPQLALVRGLDNALKFHIDIPSIINPKENNTMEGVVIKPHHRVYQTEQSVFYIKKKNKAFKEKQRASNKKPVDSSLTALNIQFRGYINPNRIESCFSKEGEIQSPTEIGKYIRLILADAKEDFLKDHPEVNDLNKQEQKIVFNAGGVIANMLKGYL